MSSSPFCTSNEFPLRSQLLSLEPLPETLHRAKLTSRRKINIQQQLSPSHLGVLLLLFLAALTPTLLALASYDSGILIVL